MRGSEGVDGGGDAREALRVPGHEHGGMLLDAAQLVGKVLISASHQQLGRSLCPNALEWKRSRTSCSSAAAAALWSSVAARRCTLPCSRPTCWVVVSAASRTFHQFRAAWQNGERGRWCLHKLRGMGSHRKEWHLDSLCVQSLFGAGMLAHEVLLGLALALRDNERLLRRRQLSVRLLQRLRRVPGELALG